MVQERTVASNFMFTQLLNYVWVALRDGEPIPPFLCVVDSVKAAYYTPLFIVDKAYDLLTQLLGKNWQREYIVVDPCCGVGNLETKHSNPRNVFMSTLDQSVSCVS